MINVVNQSALIYTLYMDSRNAIRAAVADAIRDLQEVPSGQLYAQLMAVMSLSDYEALIAALVNAGLVTRTPSHLLQWKGGR
jgi:hypothetical protein